MNNYKYKILEIETENNVITKVYYYLSAENEKNIVDTIGSCEITKPQSEKDFSNMLEKDIIQMVDSEITIDGINQVKLNLDNQLLELNLNKKTELPWLANVFTPGS